MLHTSPARAVELDASRGVLTLAPVLDPIRPAVVQVLVSHRAQTPKAPLGPGHPLPPDDFFDKPPDDLSSRDAPAAPPGRRRDVSGTGSGVVVDHERGLVLTNHHVVESAGAVRVKLTDGRTLDAEIVGRDDATDIALLRIQASDLVSVPVGDSEQLQIGDLVVAIGYPFGIDQSATLGIVSGLGREGLGKDFEDFIQTDAAVNFGNSGGALVDSRGRLVGINTAIYSRTGGNIGISFAVPTRMAMAVKDQLLEFGEVRRGRLGAQLQDISPELAEALGIESPSGALVKRVQEGSPGGQAGLRSGDVVVQAGDQRIDNVASLRNFVGLSRPGATFDLIVQRNNRQMTLSVQLQASVVATTRSGRRLGGVSFEALGADNPMSTFVEGVVVAEVDDHSTAAREGLRRGDIVTHINKQPVTNLQELGTIVESVGPLTALTVVRGNSEFIVVLRGT